MSVIKSAIIASVLLASSSAYANATDDKATKDAVNTAIIKEYSAQMMSAVYASKACTHLGMNLNKEYFFRWGLPDYYTPAQKEVLFRQMMPEVRKKMEASLFELGTMDFCNRYVEMVKKHYVMGGLMPIYLSEH